MESIDELRAKLHNLLVLYEMEKLGSNVHTSIITLIDEILEPFQYSELKGLKVLINKHFGCDLEI